MPLSDEELAKAMQAWNLETEPIKRTPYKRATERKGESIPIATRCDAFMVRRMDEILGSGTGLPDYKTRSDIVQDAIAFWLENWDQEHPDFSTPLRWQFRVEQMGRRRISRNDFLEKAKDTLDGLREDGDTTGLTHFIAALDESLTDFRQDAPVSFLSRISDLRSQAKRLLDASNQVDD